MRRLKFVEFLYLFVLIVFGSCNAKEERKIKTLTIVVQAFTDLPKSQIDYVETELKKVYPKVVVNEKIPLPDHAFYKPLSRYRADTLIHYLRINYSKQGVILGITSKDISISKGEYPDWGVIGYAYCPGMACMVSTFRLNKKQLNEQLLKAVLHELGHTFGLSHCKESECYMQDYEGKNKMNELHDFCESCKNYLNKSGWVLK